MKKLICAAAALMVISCGNAARLPAAKSPAPSTEIPAPQKTAEVFAEPEAAAAESGEIPIDEYVIPMRIMIPYTREYLSPGQETRIAVLLENGGYGDEVYFEFKKEPGKNSIEVESKNNAAVIRAVREGIQYVQISHPRAQESRFIVYDVLPPSPPPPPEIDVSESPLIIRKGETKPLRMILRNGAAGSGGFRFQAVENVYAIEARQDGDTLHITGIAPGAGKIRIQHPAALRDYDVMVIVD